MSQYPRKLYALLLLYEKHRPIPRRLWEWDVVALSDGLIHDTAYPDNGPPSGYSLLTGEPTDLVREITRKGRAELLLFRESRAAERKAKLVGAYEVPVSKVVRKNANDPRDSFIYHAMTQGKALGEIKVEVNARQQWEQLHTEQSISQAARRYAKRRNLAWPIPRSH